MTNKWHDTINTDNDHNTVNDADIPDVTDDDLVYGDELSMMTDAKKM